MTRLTLQSLARKRKIDTSHPGRDKSSREPVTRAQIELLAAAVGGLLVLVLPLVLLVRAMRRQDRRERLTNAPLTWLVVLCAISIVAWLWVTLTDVAISATISGPVQTFLLAIAAVVIYLAGSGVIVVGLFSFVFVAVLGSFTGVLLLIAAWGLEPRRRWRAWRTPAANS